MLIKVHRSWKLWETVHNNNSEFDSKSGFRQSEDKHVRTLDLHSDCHIYFTSIIYYVFDYDKHF